MQLNKNIIICKLIDDEIEIGDCVVCSDVVAGMLKPSCISKKYKEKHNWRAICKECKYYNM